MSVHQAVIASNSNTTLITDPGGGQNSIPNATPGLWRKKFNGVSSGDDPTWFAVNAGLVTSQYATTSYIRTEGAEETSPVFSLEFLGYFRPIVNGNYRFQTQSDDGSWLWIGLPATDPTLENANVNNGGAHGITLASGKLVKLTAGIYYPIRVQMWDNGGSWYLDTTWSSNAGSTSSFNFENQLFYNSSTNGF